MSENELAPRTVGKKIIIALLCAIVTTLVFGAAKFVYTRYQTSVVKSGITKTLEQYESGINTNTFDANYYFASSVPMFFEMKDQSPRLINVYWKNQFLKLFSNYHARFDYSTLTVACGDETHCATIYMYSDYLKNNVEKQFTNQKSRYDLKFDKEFRIVEVKQVVYE